MVSVTESQVCVHVTPFSMALTALYNISYAPIIVRITVFVTDLPGPVFVTMIITVMTAHNNISFVPIFARIMDPVTV